MESCVVKVTKGLSSNAAPGCWPFTSAERVDGRLPEREHAEDDAERQKGGVPPPRLRAQIAGDGGGQHEEERGGGEGARPAEHDLDALERPGWSDAAESADLDAA